MDAHVLGVRQHFQVVGPVIEFVAVPVMHPFVREQGTAKGLHRYEAMFEDVTSIDSNHPIAVRVDKGSTAPMSGSLAAGSVRASAGAVETPVPPAKLPLLQTELPPAALTGHHAIGATYALHQGPVYHFDEDVS